MTTPGQISLSNQSLLFSVFGDHEKLTITEATDRVNEKLKAQDESPLSEQTIRRAINGLVKSGFVRSFGRQHNAMLYGKLSASWTEEDEKIVNVAGKLVTVSEFFELIADEERNPYPFVVKVQPGNWPISDEFHRKLRKRLVKVVMSSVDPGFNDALKNHAAFLQNHINELEFLLTVMRSFLDSPVWFAQHRDRLGHEIRKLQKNDPELFQLANEYLRDT